MTSDRDKMQAAFDAASARVPTDLSWGFFSYDDGPLMRGGGIGSFVWFETRDEMLTFIRDYLVALRGPAGVDRTVVLEHVPAVIDGIKTGRVFPDSALATLNDAARGHCQVSWWGTFGGIRSGDGKLAREVREWFRENRDDEPTNAPISDDELEEFREALLDYGL